MKQLHSQQDEPGTQREYETIYILRPDSNTDQIHDVNSRVRKIIEAANGKLIRVDNWGKRKLAYEIRKELKGIYLHWLYLGEANLVTEIERNLRMLDMVIRYYTVKVDDNVDPEARPTMMDDESFAATATTVPDEEDAYLRRREGEEAAAEGADGETPTAEGDKPVEAATSAPEGDKPATEGDNAPAPAEAAPAEAAPAEAAPAEAAPAEAAPAEAAPAATAPAEAAPAATADGDTADTKKEE